MSRVKRGYNCKSGDQIVKKFNSLTPSFSYKNVCVYNEHIFFFRNLAKENGGMIKKQHSGMEKIRKINLRIKIKTASVHTTHSSNH